MVELLFVGVALIFGAKTAALAYVFFLLDKPKD